MDETHEEGKWTKLDVGSPYPNSTTVEAMVQPRQSQWSSEAETTRAWEPIDSGPTNMVRSKGPTILFLIETKQNIPQMRKLGVDLGFQSVLAVPSEGWSGMAECNLHLQTFSPNHINADI